MYDQGQGAKQNDTESFRWFLKAGLKCEIFAQFNLGAMYEAGTGVKQSIKSITEAYRWYEKAALQGHGDAQFNIGKWALWVEVSIRARPKLSAGMGKQLIKESLRLSSTLESCTMRGTLWRRSQLRWIFALVQESKEQSNAAAQVKLGSIYFEGRGVNKSDKDAIHWFQKAANQGHGKAKELQRIQQPLA